VFLPSNVKISEKQERKNVKTHNRHLKNIINAGLVSEWRHSRCGLYYRRFMQGELSTVSSPIHKLATKL